jgi:O-antigen ligase
MSAAVMEMLIAIAALAGLVWGVWLFWRGSQIDGALAFILTICCFGYHFVHFDLGPVPLTLDRVLLVFLAGQYVLLRLTGRADPKPLTFVDWSLGAFVVLLTGSMLSTDMSQSLKGDTSPVWRLIGGYVTPLAIYWLVRQSPIDARATRHVQGFLAGYGVYLGIISLLEMAKLWPLVFPTYIADPTVGLHFGRARGPMVQAVSYGHYVGVCMLAAWMWRPSLGRVGQAVITLLTPLFLAGILFSFTRSVWMGAAAGLFITLLIVLPAAWRWLMLGGGMLAGVLVLTTSLESLVGFQREQSAAETKESAELRVSFAYVSWKMFLDRPWFGVGFGRFPLAKLDYLDDRTTELEISLLRPYVHHNTLLSLLTETGAIGLGLFLTTMGGWSWMAWRIIRQQGIDTWPKRHALLTLGAMAVYAPQLLFHEMSYSSLDNSLLFLLAGMTVGLCRTQVAPAVQRKEIELVDSRSAMAIYAG